MRLVSIDVFVQYFPYGKNTFNRMGISFINSKKIKNYFAKVQFRNKSENLTMK